MIDPGSQNGFEDANGLDVRAGDRVLYTINGRKGLLMEALQDGDAYVQWDDGLRGEVKWRHLLKS